MRRFSRTLFWLIGLCACTVGPKYHAPEDVVSDPWHTTDDPTISIDSPTVAWWSLLGDDLLNQLIEQTACNNKQLAEAEANILQARAIRDVTASKLFPQVTGDMSAVKTYFSKNGPAFALTPGGGAGGGVSSSTTGLPFSIQIPQVQNLYTALFDASWEIDLFGKTRRAVEAANARIGSAIEQRNDLLISLLAEVARTYVELRSFQQKADYFHENIALLEQNERIIQDQHRVGYVDQTQVETIALLLAHARAELPDVIAHIYQSIYVLSVLTGQQPEALVDQLVAFVPLPRPPDVVAVGLRSDLLRRRPDIRKAERELAAATADVGVAVASFFPTFSLLGDAGLQSLQIRNLFQSASKTWAYGGDFNFPIYEGGKLVGNLHATQAAQTIALNSYQQIVLTALQDTESALVAYSENRKMVEEQQKGVARAQAIVDITSDQFTQGLVNQQDLIASQRELVSAEEILLTADTASLINLIALYKSLGGGWEPQKN